MVGFIQLFDFILNGTPSTQEQVQKQQIDQTPHIKQIMFIHAILA